MPKEKARVPQPFRHHNPDGSVNEDSLFDVSRRFMYIRQQVSMAPTEIIALANHLCAHFDMRGMTAPPPIQATLLDFHRWSVLSTAEGGI